MGFRSGSLAAIGPELAALGLVAAVTLGLSACGQGQSTDPIISHVSPTTTAPPLPGGYGLIPAARVLSDRIVLNSTRIASGQSIGGALLVLNQGPVPINLTKTCRPNFVVVLTSSIYTPQVAWTSGCAVVPFIIAPGTNRFPVQVTTTYLGCHQSRPPSTAPKCLSSGPPSLPVGNYDAVLVGDGGLALPKPQPVPVTLCKGSA
jgi:hypothetical protein